MPDSVLYTVKPTSQAQKPDPRPWLGKGEEVKREKRHADAINSEFDESSQLKVGGCGPLAMHS